MPSESDPSDAPGPAVPGHGEHVLAGYRLLRLLAGGERADIYLAVDAAHHDAAGPPSGAPAAPLVVVRVYGADAAAEVVATEIEAMEVDPTGTLPRLLDLGRGADGRTCLVVERIQGTSLAALLAAGGLPPGQVVTLMAPVLVAVRELGARGLVHGRLAASDILVDGSGRPRLLGLGALERVDGRTPASDRTARSREAHAALLRLLEDAAAASTDRAAFAPLLAAARSAVDARPFRRVEDELERLLFEVAPAQPVLSALDRPSHDRSSGRFAAQIRSDAALAAIGFAASEPDQPGGRAGTRLRRIAELAQIHGAVVEHLAETLDSRPGTGLARRVRRWTAARRPVVLTGGLAGGAALVALLTAVPPSAGQAERASAGAEGAGTHAAPSTAAVEPGPLSEGEAIGAEPSGASPSIEHVAVEDPVAAAAALLEVRHTCLVSGDLDCVLAVDQPGSAIAARDRAAIESGAAQRAEPPTLDGITVAADLGDAIVLTVPDADPEREPASLLMMRSEAGWRLRDWFD